MVDGNRELEKERQNQLLALDNKDPIEVIYGEVECPYFDFVSVSDRWLPTEKSYDRALSGKFDACNVIFLHSGSFVVPWTRKKFKEEIATFAEQAKKITKLGGLKILDITRDEFLKRLGEEHEPAE